MKQKSNPRINIWAALSFAIWLTGLAIWIATNLFDVDDNATGILFVLNSVATIQILMVVIPLLILGALLYEVWARERATRNKQNRRYATRKQRAQAPEQRWTREDVLLNFSTNEIRARFRRATPP